ncbi:MAG: TAXI family TRAP transporter solute-binding subunit [Candidatus Pacearchaeota archaeon]
MKTILIFLLTLSFSFCAKKYQFKVASGFKEGTYYKIVESLKLISNFEIENLSSEGSIDNLYKISDGKADVGLTQLDVYFNTSIGSPEVFDKVKILFPVYGEELHIVAQRKYEKLESLKGKKISIGDSESGTKITSLIFLSQLDINGQNTGLEEFNYTDSLSKLLKGELDAFILVAGAPVKVLAELEEDVKTKIQLLSVPDIQLKTVQGTGLVYKRTEIPSATYSWEVKPVSTLLIQSIFVGRTSLSKEEVKALIKEIWRSQEKLATRHEKWKSFNLRTLQEHVNNNEKFFHPSVKEILKEL